MRCSPNEHGWQRIDGNGGRKWHRMSNGKQVCCKSEQMIKTVRAEERTESKQEEDARTHCNAVLLRCRKLERKIHTKVGGLSEQPKPK